MNEFRLVDIDATPLPQLGKVVRICGYRSHCAAILSFPVRGRNKHNDSSATVLFQCEIYHDWRMVRNVERILFQNHALFAHVNFRRLYEHVV